MVAGMIREWQRVARPGPLPRTTLREGIADTYRRFSALRAEGRLDLSDLGP